MSVNVAQLVTVELRIDRDGETTATVVDTADQITIELTGDPVEDFKALNLALDEVRTMKRELRERKREK